MFSYSIDKLQGIIFTQVCGRPTFVLMIDNIQNVMNDPDFDPHYNSIIFFEENTRIPGIGKEEAEIIRRILNGYEQNRKGRNWAVVAPNKRIEAFLRLNLEMIGSVGLKIRIFRNEDEALTWIKDR